MDVLSKGLVIGRDVCVCVCVVCGVCVWCVRVIASDLPQFVAVDSFSRVSRATKFDRAY